MKQIKPQRQQDTKDHKDFVLLSAFAPSWFNELNHQGTKPRRNMLTLQMLFYTPLHFLKDSFLTALSPAHHLPVSMSAQLYCQAILPMQFFHCLHFSIT